MKKTDKIIKFTSPFSKQELTFIVSDELTRDQDKIHNSAFVRRKVEKANQTLRSLSPEGLAFLRSILSPK